MAKFKIENFNGTIVHNIIKNRKLNFDKKIRTVTISDLHSYTTNVKRAKRLVEAVKKLDADIIFIAGDIFNGGTPWNGGNKYEYIKFFCDELSKICPVCITLGNHDLMGLDELNKEKRESNFRELEKTETKQVFPLLNDRVVINGVEVVGFVPRYELMGKEGLKTQLHGLAHDQFIDDYNSRGAKFKDSTSVNVFLGHDPHLFAASENGVGLGGLSVTDMFISGHMHDGYKTFLAPIDKIKKFLTGTGIKGLELDNGYTEQPTGVVDKDGNMIKGSKRIWLGPTNLCRGIVYIDDDAQQRVLQLPDDSFYINTSIEQNVQVWKKTIELLAREEVINHNYHALLISEGITPSFFPEERLANINVVDITNDEVKTLKM